MHVRSVARPHTAFPSDPKKLFLFDSVVLRLHASFGMCTRSCVHLSLYVCTCVFACMLYCSFGSLPARAKTVICINAFWSTSKGSGSALRFVQRARDVLRSACSNCSTKTPDCVFSNPKHGVCNSVVVLYAHSLVHVGSPVFLCRPRYVLVSLSLWPSSISNRIRDEGGL